MPGAPSDNIRACRAIARSKEHYVDPNRFDPERFLAEDGQLKQDILHPRSYVFGFGRRCVSCGLLII